MLVPNTFSRGTGVRDADHDRAIAWLRETQSKPEIWTGVVEPILTSARMLSDQTRRQRISIDPNQIIARSKYAEDQSKRTRAFRQIFLEQLEPDELRAYLSDHITHLEGHKLINGATLYVPIEELDHQQVDAAKRAGIKELSASVIGVSTILPTWQVGFTQMAAEGKKSVRVFALSNLPPERKITVVLPGEYEEQARLIHYLRGGEIIQS